MSNKKESDPLTKVPVISTNISAPGVIILHGECVTAFRKTAVAAALDRRTHLMIDNTSILYTSQIELHIPRMNLRHLCCINAMYSCILSEPLHLIKGVHRCSFNLETPEYIDIPKVKERLDTYIESTLDMKQYSINQIRALTGFFFMFAGMFSSINLLLIPLNIYVISDLPPGVELGYPVTYCVCLAAGFLYYIRECYEYNKVKQMSRIGYKKLYCWCEDLYSFDDRDREMIYRWAYLCNKVMGPSANIIDSIACTYGSFIQVKETKNEQKPKIRLIPNPGNIRVLLIKTHITQELSMMIEKVALLRKRHILVGDPLLEAIDRLSKNSAETIRHLAVLRHDSDQSKSVQTAIDHEMFKFGELITLNQRLLSALGFSHPDVDQIVEIIEKFGLHIKMTGSVSCGYAFMLIPSVIEGMQIAFIKKQLQGYASDFIVSHLGGPGVRLAKPLAENEDVINQILDSMIIKATSPKKMFFRSKHMTS